MPSHRVLSMQRHFGITYGVLSGKQELIAVLNQL